MGKLRAKLLLVFETENRTTDFRSLSLNFLTSAAVLSGKCFGLMQVGGRVVGKVNDFYDPQHESTIIILINPFL